MCISWKANDFIGKNHATKPFDAEQAKVAAKDLREILYFCRYHAVEIVLFFGGSPEAFCYNRKEFYAWAQAMRRVFSELSVFVVDCLGMYEGRPMRDTYHLAYSEKQHVIDFCIRAMSLGASFGALDIAESGKRRHASCFTNLISRPPVKRERMLAVLSEKHNKLFQAFGNVVQVSGQPNYVYLYAAESICRRFNDGYSDRKIGDPEIEWTKVRDSGELSVVQYIETSNELQLGDTDLELAIVHVGQRVEACCIECGRVQVPLFAGCCNFVDCLATDSMFNVWRLIGKNTGEISVNHPPIMIKDMVFGINSKAAIKQLMTHRRVSVSERPSISSELSEKFGAVDRRVPKGPELITMASGQGRSQAAGNQGDVYRLQLSQANIDVMNEALRRHDLASAENSERIGRSPKRDVPEGDDMDDDSTLRPEKRAKSQDEPASSSTGADHPMPDARPGGRLEETMGICATTFIKRYQSRRRPQQEK